jgi:hypothetical protein
VREHDYCTFAVYKVRASVCKEATKVLQRILDWIDEAAGGLIRITYLAAGVTAVAAWFGAGALPDWVEGALSVALPWLLAFSFETHTYLTARRVSRNWNLLQSPVLDKVVRSATRRDLIVNIGVLLLLLGFSFWNQLNYNLEHWHPDEATLMLPLIWEMVIKSAAVPAFFLAAAFLAKQAETIGESMNSEAHRTLVQFLKVLRRQRKQALAVIKKQPVDMSQAIEAVGTAANEKKAATMIGLVQRAIVRLASGTSPEVAAREATPTPVTQRLAGKRGTPADRCRRAYRQGMGWRQLMTAAQVSESTAKRYAKQFDKEMSA